MKSMFTKVVLGAALVAGTMGLGATQAQAERVRIVVGGPVAYVPPCPGRGYFWVAGYYDGAEWVPGFWRAPRVDVVVNPGFTRGPYYYHPDRDRYFDRDFRSDRDFRQDRDFRRDRDFRHDRDHR